MAKMSAQEKEAHNWIYVLHRWDYQIGEVEKAVIKAEQIHPNSKCTQRSKSAFVRP